MFVLNLIALASEVDGLYPVYCGMDGHRHRLVHHRGVVASWQSYDCPESIAIFGSGRTEKHLRLVVHKSRFGSKHW